MVLHVVKILVCALGARLAYLTTAYLLHARGVQRFHVEAASLVFVAAGVLAQVIARRSAGVRRPDIDNEARLADGRAPRLLLWATLVVAAFALYWPTLTVGFLSDDFVLADHARQWHLGPLSPIFFRPLPMLAWAATLSLGGGALLLHVLNVVLHGTNAYLVTRVARGWLDGFAAPAITGLMFLTTPIAVEAVSWRSGIFDISATTCVLGLILLGRRSDVSSVAGRVGFVALGLVGIACKELAAVGPILVAIDAIVMRRFTCATVVNVGILVAICAAIAWLRVSGAAEVTTDAVSRYGLQRGVFQSFGGLAMPLHSDVIDAAPWLPLAVAGVTIGALATAFVSAWPSFGASVGALFWIGAAVLPVLAILTLPADMQGSRYLYLASVAWAVVSVAIGLAAARWSRAVAIGLAAGWIATAVFATRANVAAWSDAARLRDVTIRGLASALPDCAEVHVTGLPDNVRSAYLFRVGAREAIQAGAGKTMVAEAPVGCTAAWVDGKWVSAEGAGTAPPPTPTSPTPTSARPTSGAPK